MRPGCARTSEDGHTQKNVVGSLRSGVVYRFDQDLRTSVTHHLERFERQAMSTADEVRAAVALIIVPDEREEACFVLTRRAASLRSHAGQWALPGGRIEPGESAADAARREAEEEIGLKSRPDEVLATLDDYATRSGYVVTPVVIWSDQRAQMMKANASEVESIHLVPLADLDHPNAPRFIDIPESHRPVIQMPLMGHWIHAPTAAILLQLRDVALHGLATRVSSYDQPTWAWR